ncbi:MAG: ATP-binding protein [Chloroflexota bacterium]
MSIFQHISTHLLWKLLLSYLIVIFVGVVTLVLTAEAAIPTAFNRHMLTMQMVMNDIGTSHEMGLMAGDLFTNFRTAVTEAVLISSATALATAIVVSIFVSRRVITPITLMTQASQRIAAGRYQERVPVSGQDELAQLATSFNQMAQALEQTETMRRNLIADVAHELRTPLASIQGYMEGLIDEVLPADPDTYQQIYEEADRLQRLVNNLHDLSRIEAGAFELTYTAVPVNELITTIATRLQPQFDEKGLNLQLDLLPNLPQIQADKDRLSQILINLIGNALQYTPKGGQVTVSTNYPHNTNSVNHLLITVSDTGIGIAAEHIPHLFTRFYRVDKSRSRVGGGSGIGLTIVSHLVEAHQGYAWVVSDGMGQGSQFSISLPLEPITL